MIKQNVAVVIGRFQIFHNGHEHLIQSAITNADLTIILVGSSYQASNITNPFSFSERLDYITKIFSKEVLNGKLLILPIQDFKYNPVQWVSNVGQVVTNNVPKDSEITLYGHHKDASSYYLDEFPQWKFQEVQNYQNLSSHSLREIVYKIDDNHLDGITELMDNVPNKMYQYLNDVPEEKFSRLQAEYHFVKRYKKQWENAPYKVPMVTVDAVVYCKGHILMVKRKAQPGKGLWALPGGFFDVEEDDSIEMAIVRELKEETKIKDFHKFALLNLLEQPVVFAAKSRSIRGRTITHAGLIKLYYPRSGLPKVKGSDDAEKAKWVPLGELNSIKGMENTFEDHNHIIRSLTDNLSTGY